MKKKDLIITIIFICILIMPNVLYWLSYDNMDHTNYENRNLFEKPVLKFSKILEFSSAFENYYNDNLAFKNEIRINYSNFLYHKFNMSSNKRVIIGKDGWLFYNSVGDGDSMNDYRKVNNYSFDKKENIKNNLVGIYNKLEKIGSEFYIFVAPNKENVYSEFMPNMINVNKKNTCTPVEDLLNYLDENTELNIVYPKESLIDNKKTFDTYYKFDTHWNNYGAYIGTLELIKTINPSFELSNINIEKTDNGGDLSNMILMSNYLSNKEPIVLDFLSHIQPECQNKDNLKFCSASNAIYNKTLLVIGDSFREGTVQYLSKVYSNTIFVHIDHYDDSIFYKYNPNIVVYETVERYSFMLDYIKILN